MTEPGFSDLVLSFFLWKNKNRSTMKATKYTREQLVQAINYWTTKLRRVDETTSSNYLIDELMT